MLFLFYMSSFYGSDSPLFFLGMLMATLLDMFSSSFQSLTNSSNDMSIISDPSLFSYVYENVVVSVQLFYSSLDKVTIVLFKTSCVFLISPGSHFTSVSLS